MHMKVVQDYKEELKIMRQEEERQEGKREARLAAYKSSWKTSSNPIVRIFYYYEKVEYFLFFVGASIIMLLMFMLSAEVVGRYVFNQPIPGQMEFVESLLPVTVLLGLAMTQRRYGQVRMDLLLGRATGKKRAYWEAGTQILTFFVMLPCAIFGTKWFIQMAMLGDRTEDLEILLWPFKMWVPVGFGMLLIRCIAEAVQWIVSARTGKEYVHESRAH